ncbi:MAG: AhpC/TSA family protein [Chitinophagaceae bacterium]|nr:AhpC/TSA family protein [Chitinophagaceae bacterium]
MKKLLLVLFFIRALGAIGQEKPEGLFIHSKAPDFKAKDLTGVAVNLKDFRKKGPVVLVFYRGNWCPYCNKALSRLQDSLQFIKEKGATLIAITPEGQEGIIKTAEKTKAEFPIIYDEDLKIMKAYEVAYKVDDKAVSRYKNFDIDLAANNNQKPDAVYLPVPAVYIIDREGNITYRYFEPDYKKRASVKEILKNLP